MRIRRIFVLLAFALCPVSAGAQSLRDAAEGKFLIGTAIGSDTLNNPQKAALVAAQFSAITAENDFKPQPLEPQPGMFTFETADRIARFTAANHQVLIGHTLCWHQQSPKWMFAAADGSPLPREQGLANLKRHIDGVVGHFRGKVLGWDVVNEALDDGNGYLRDTPARRSIGDDYIVRAFEFAHAADPAAELYYNDYNIESGSKLAKVLRLRNELEIAGVRIDAIGIQGHWSMQSPKEAGDLEHAINVINDPHVKVQFTELDIDMLPGKRTTADISDTQNRKPTAAENPYVNGLPAPLLAAQKDRYGQLFKLFVEHRKQIRRVTFWGYNDRDSWLNNYPMKGRTNYPLLFDRSLNPKPAFEGVLEALGAK